MLEMLNTIAMLCMSHPLATKDASLSDLLYHQRSCQVGLVECVDDLRENESSTLQTDVERLWACVRDSIPD